MRLTGRGVYDVQYYKTTNLTLRSKTYYSVSYRAFNVPYMTITLHI